MDRLGERRSTQITTLLARSVGGLTSAVTLGAILAATILVMSWIRHIEVLDPITLESHITTIEVPSATSGPSFFRAYVPPRFVSIQLATLDYLLLGLIAVPAYCLELSSPRPFRRWGPIHRLMSFSAAAVVILNLVLSDVAEPMSGTFRLISMQLARVASERRIIPRFDSDLLAGGTSALVLAISIVASFASHLACAAVGRSVLFQAGSGLVVGASSALCWSALLISVEAKHCEALVGAAFGFGVPVALMTGALANQRLSRRF